MKTFLLDIIPKIQKNSQKLDDVTLLMNQNWVLIDSIGTDKTIYIFRKNDELLVSVNGIVSKGKWEYLGNNSILIEQNDIRYLFKQGFFDKNILALRIDNSKEYAVFVNENEFDGELNTIQKIEEFIEENYLKNNLSSSGSEEKEKFVYKRQITKKAPSEGKMVLRKFGRYLGVFIIIFSFLWIISYSSENQEQIAFHIFNDRSMCFCGPGITQADPIGDLFVISFIGIIGVVVVIINKKK